MGFPRSWFGLELSSAGDGTGTLCPPRLSREPFPDNLDEFVKLGPCFEDKVERCLGGAAEMFEAGGLDDVADPFFSCLRAECRADFLSE